MPNRTSLYLPATPKTILVVGLSIALLLLLVSSAAQAANITVAAGEVDIDANGTCSLLEAIENANDTTDGTVYDDCATGNPAGADTISLTNSTYNLTASQASDLGPSGLIISSDISISGNGATISRDSGGNYRLFYVGATGDLTLNEVTLDNGSAKGGNGGNGKTGSGTGFGGGGGGGGLGGNGANGTAVSNCTSKSKGGGGGGEQAAGSSTTGGLTTGGNGNTGSGGQAGGVGGGGGGGGQSGGCSGRSGGAGGFGGGGGGGGNPTAGAAGGFGGGGGGAGLNNNTSTQSGGSGGTFGSSGQSKSGSNRTGGGGGGAAGLGGALIIDGGTVVINRSTLMDNKAQGGNGGSSSAGDGGKGAGLGGAIFVRSGDLTVTNSTFTGNSALQGSSGNGNAKGHGAAIFVYDGTATLNYNTFSDNTNTTGGTVYLWDDASVSGVLHMTGNIVANTSGGDDCSATTLTTNAVNLIEDNTCSPAVSGDPLLASLGDYGGETQTMALLPGSPALDAATATCESTDQRSVSRPYNGTCDIGAFESQGFNLSINGGDNQSTATDTAFPEDLEVTVAPNVAGEPIGSGIAVNFTAPGSGASLSSTSFSANTDTSGLVSSTVTANSQVGSYTVMAEAPIIGASVSFSLTNILPDIAPDFDSISDQTITETGTLSFTVTATDANGDDLTYGLDNPTSGMSIDSSTGEFSWTPTEAQGPGTYATKFVVTDTTDLTDEATITITVNEDNQAPVLATLSDQAVQETNLFTLTISATDADLPANDLTYSMTNAPSGASLDSDSGLFSWTPATDQGPGEYPITFTVEDDGSPQLSDSQTITVTVFDRLPALVITKTVQLTNDPPSPGEAITYTITISNSGGQADDVSVQDVLPVELEGDDLSWTGSIAENSTETFTVPATIASDAGYGTIISNTASVSHLVGDESDAVSFTTMADTTAPDVSGLTLLTPLGTISDTQRPTFDWTDATDSQSGVVSYTLLITGSGSSQEVVVTTSAYTPTADLASSDPYTWTVKAHDAVGNSGEYVSPAATFEITMSSSETTIYLPMVIKNH